MSRYSKEDKKRWLREYKTSGLTAKAFSKDKPFVASTLLYWKKQDISTDGNANHFIELIPSQTMTNKSINIIYPNGVMVEMNQMPSIGVLKQLIGC